ncbi:hypothetical protein FVEN_g8771 [Fusarium venenatum]|uniref:uncharacterized protein n=1 Tax=Fusarium venenatum TaxID=56646 RepID=UPI001DED3269|nr:hypothetical protein FVEN_g8771 [Fusarium venenatum]KAH7004844.1 hypothetical protein EDB82DRAFT_60889 [Fusarium venenatum]
MAEPMPQQPQQRYPDLLTQQPPILTRRKQCRNLSEPRDPEDDWMGITDSSDRRRRQNRLNQRAYRKRKARDSTHDDSATTSEGILILPTPRDRAIAYAFVQLVQVQHSLNSHRPAILPSLIRLNAVNAVSNNALHIGIPLEGLCCDDVTSPWSIQTFGPLESTTTPLSCPESLYPTKLQTEIEHHPWVDLLPIPQLRDNMLRAYTGGIIDEDELCFDILGVTCSQGLDDAYLIVWGESHNAASWEVSVGFLKKWGWLLKGCPELVESTNRWRQQRGESTLDILI